MHGGVRAKQTRVATFVCPAATNRTEHGERSTDIRTRTKGRGESTRALVGGERPISLFIPFRFETFGVSGDCVYRTQTREQTGEHRGVRVLGEPRESVCADSRRGRESLVLSLPLPPHLVRESAVTGGELRRVGHTIRSSPDARELRVSGPRRPARTERLEGVTRGENRAGLHAA